MSRYSITTEFPDYDLTTLPPIPEGWADTSHRNDVCPCWQTPVDADGLAWCVYVDYADISARAYGDIERYTAHRVDADGHGPVNGLTYYTNDWDALLARVTR
jgi:hypothetical protein